MANILFFVHKKNFDLLFCRYLRLFHKVSLITSDPMIGLFLNAQDEEVEKLYELTPLQNNILLMSLQKEALMETQLYTVTSDPQKKEALENLCSAYLQCMHELVCQKRIDLIVTHDSVFLDVACISSIANFHNLPVCYLGSGLFRGETITVSSERMYINNPDIWNSRWQNTTRRPLIVHQLLDEVKYDPGHIKKSSQISLIWQISNEKKKGLMYIHFYLHPQLKGWSVKVIFCHFQQLCKLQLMTGVMDIREMLPICLIKL